MSVAVKKIEGVDSVKVSLNDGKAVVKLKPGNSVRLEQIRQAVTDQGFTPKEARVVAVGELTATDAGMQFRVSGSNEAFPVEPPPHAAWREKAGTNLLVTGLVSARQSDKEPSLQLLEVSKEHVTEKKE